ncbi:MAG: PEP-CTERM sorting domain-containing protein [Planctomycetota bacterium]
MSRKAYQSLLVVPAVIFLLLGRTSHAEFTLAIEDTNVIAGSESLTLEVGVTPVGSSAAFSDYILILEITPLTSTGDSTLRFLNEQSDDFLEDADYVFVGNSDVFNEGDSPVFSVTAEELVLEDLTADFADAVFTERRLMATFDIGHFLGTQSAASTVGDQYQVSISNESDFGNQTGAPIFNFMTDPGTLTIVAIPEPAIASMLMIGAMGFATRRRRTNHRG